MTVKPSRHCEDARADAPGCPRFAGSLDMEWESDKLENTAHSGDGGAIRHLKESVAAGKPWHIALLEAIGLWTCPGEKHNGHSYCYLRDGEAFDWLLLAERLCGEIKDFIPEQEMLDLLFSGRLPGELSGDEFRAIIGNAKYHAYLNHLYGITVERFVLLAVEEEIYKESNGHVFSGREGGLWDSYRRLYGASQEALLKRFREEKGYPREDTLDLERLEEFTYWLFKYRLKNCDGEKVASDTRKGVECLRRYMPGEFLDVPRGNTSEVIENGI